FVFHGLSGNRLIWFTDLYEVLAHYRGEIDWAALVERSKQAGTEGVIATTLTLLTRLSGPVVVPAVLEEMDPPRTTFVKRSVLRWLQREFAAAEEGEAPPRTFLQAKLLVERKGVDYRLIRLADP
ncbi:MAG: hypothetical protein ACE5KY_00095, partial [Candidatus Tectimicrobiota bacterium]